ncbi:MAG: tRNA glutamyl-Q(34) synthetase GluQRS [Myxococcales bacterium]|nr:tRNA glutamyl-Q(34) synthetase GluQRS [Myxococcales bacterium]
MSVTGRLAPTPSGRLHLGNVTAFGCAWLSARAGGGRLLLRIEDVDRGRARDEVEASILEDLRWLGLDWDEQTAAQRDRDYEPWLAGLADRTYRCTCTRAQLAGLVAYPGTCRTAGHTDGAVRFRLPEGQVDVVDRVRGHRRVDPAIFGDPVLRRRDGVFAYNLAVVVDDLVDGVSEVVRGADLLDSTPRQILLWRALRAEPPRHAHLPVAVDAAGRKLGKQTGAPPTSALAAPVVLGQVLAFLGHPLPATLAGAPADQILAWAVASWDLARVPATAPGTVYTAPEDDDLDSR